LDGANKYKCPRQNKAVRALKRMSVDAAPNVLMIQLKRFEFSFSGHKISKKVRSTIRYCWVGWSYVGVALVQAGLR
jgi:ubiquitin C-terminal hydrolase